MVSKNSIFLLSAITVLFVIVSCNSTPKEPDDERVNERSYMQDCTKVRMPIDTTPRLVE
jgi:hypothetical protein